MEFSKDEKINFLKAFTKLLKNANGKGPDNIYIKYFDTDLHIVMQGIISDFEKYVIKNFGQEAIDVFDDFYQRDCINAERDFLSILGNRYKFKFYELISDFENDVFIYKLRIVD